MTGRIVTSVVLTVFTGLVVALARRNFTINRETETDKFLYWLISGYLIAIIWLFIKVYRFENIHDLILISSFCPITFLVVTLMRRYGCQTTLNPILGSLMLSSIGLIFLYRLKLDTAGLLSRLLKLHELPVVYNHFTFTVVSVVFVTFLVCSGALERILEWVERTVGEWFLGIASFFLLMIPYLLTKAGIGSVAGRTSAWIYGRSGQVTEFVCKLLFIFFLAKFLSKRKLALNCYGKRGESFRVILFLVALVSIFFFTPIIVFQRDLGAALMCSICAIYMVYVATGRFYLLLAGFLMLIGSIAIGTIFSPHIAERVCGAWVYFERFAFTCYPGGSDRWPGFQLFSALSSVKAADFLGTGLGSGLPKVTHVTSDFIGSAIWEELGWFGLIVVASIFLLYFKPLLQSKLRPDFYGLTFVGVTLIVVCQAYFNLAYTLGVAPISGLPLPFLSNGGSAILSIYLCVGIMTVLHNRLSGSTT